MSVFFHQLHASQEAATTATAAGSSEEGRGKGGAPEEQAAETPEIPEEPAGTQSWWQPQTRGSLSSEGGQGGQEKLGGFAGTHCCGRHAAVAGRKGG